MKRSLSARGRTFLSLVAITACLVMHEARVADTLAVRLLYVGSPDDTAQLGIRQGLDEANLQGRFLGQAYTLDTADAARAVSMELAPFLAILTATDEATARTLAGHAAGRPVFNLRSADDPLRAECIGNLLHVIPSERMRQDAVAQWRSKHADARVTATAWHHDFMKYAGRDLNKRFSASFKANMDEYAWAGWAAIKMISDTVAREQITDPAALLAFLRSKLAFDGQKGVEMTFREDGQLRQPLLLVESGKLVGEAPVRGVASYDELDTLGAAECAK